MGNLKDVTYQCPNAGQISGKLVFTNYKLFFYGPPANKKVSTGMPYVKFILSKKSLIFAYITKRSAYCFKD